MVDETKYTNKNNNNGNKKTLNGDEITIVQFDGGQLLYYALGEVN